MRQPTLLGAAFAILATPSAALATTYVLNPDGTGDLATIQAAVDVATAGDIIELTDGVYQGEGNRDILIVGKAITIRSHSGDPALCAIDCGGSTAEPHTAFECENVAAPGVRIEGLDIRNSWIDDFPYCAIDCRSSVLYLENVWVMDAIGRALDLRLESTAFVTECRFERNSFGAIWADWPSFMTLSACTFEDNTGTSYGGAVILGGSGGVIQDCTFEGHDANWGGAIYFNGNGSVRLERCEFVRNESFTGAVCFHQASGADLLVRDCVFIDNPTTGVYCLAGSSARFEGCTFFGNRRAADANSECDLVFERCILAGSEREAVYCRTSSSATMTCCNVWGNTGGDWQGCLDGQADMAGNFSADPGFCDAKGGNCALHDDSPCLSGNHPDGTECGLIGALGVGCVATLVEEASWGSLKNDFR